MSSGEIGCSRVAGLRASWPGPLPRTGLTYTENVHQVDSPLFDNGGPVLPQNRVDQARTTSMRRPSLATRTTVCDGEVTNRFLSNPPSGLWSSPANEGQLDLPARTRDSLSLLAGSGENRQLQTNTPPCLNDLYATESVHRYARLNNYCAIVRIT